MSGRIRKRLLSAALLVAGERHNATFGNSKHRVARIHAFIARQVRKERRRQRAQRQRRNPQHRGAGR